MIGRRKAMLAGERLNQVVRHYEKEVQAGLISTESAKAVENAVRTANEIIYQYYRIPREKREEYEVDEHGVRVQDMAERGM